MKKILIAFDEKHFSEGAFTFAQQLNELEPILLIGVFLPQVIYANLWNYTEGVAGPILVPLANDEENDVAKKNIKRFEDLCIKNGIDYRIHKDFYDFSLPELQKETRFADLLILGTETFYENLGATTINDYLKDALHAAECSVILVPEKYDFPKSNILTYDGSASSVYAIKQFIYLFPELCNQKTVLVFANEDKKAEFPEEEYIKELAARHFKDLTFFKLDVNPKKYFSTWVNEKKGVMLISGAFGRSSLSQFFKKSFITDIISEHKLPLFIAHR